jgi:hypothetical protein
MQPQTLEHINEKVFEQFPYLKDVQPTQSGMEGENHLLVYKGEARTESGFSLPIVVRVVVAENGKIIKITSSR